MHPSHKMSFPPTPPTYVCSPDVIRSMREANSAFLSKLGWRVLAEPKSLWSRVLRSKYCEGRCSIDMFKPRRDASNAWKGIIENMDILRKGLGVAVGNGSDTSFWRHAWVTSKPLIDLVVRPPPSDLLEVRVQDMWSAEVGWKFEQFTEFLDADSLQLIDSFELHEDPRGNRDHLLEWRSIGWV